MNLTFTRTADAALITRVYTHPQVYDHITDDYAAPREAFVLEPHPEIWYVAAWDADELLGIITLVPQSRIAAQIHVAMLPSAWGERAQAAAAAVFAWIWEATPFRRITGSTPAYNRVAVRFALRAGMERIGVDEKSFQKHHKLHDQILTGMSKPYCCRVCRPQEGHI